MRISEDSHTGPPAFQNVTRSGFLNEIIGSLAGTLQDVIGLEEASSFVSLAGTYMGRRVEQSYTDIAGSLPSDPEALAEVLTEFKRRIGGDFAVESVTPDCITLTNSRCPFAQVVEGRPALCMMTTNVFGRLAASARGYARVHVDEALATGHGRCRVQIHLRPDTGDEGHEFFA